MRTFKGPTDPTVGLLIVSTVSKHSIAYDYVLLGGLENPLAPNAARP